MLGRTDRRLRLVIVLVIFAGLAVTMVARLSYWQLSQATVLRDQAAAQLTHTTEDPALRGDIIDRNGTVLATTSFTDLLAASPAQLGQDRTLTETLARLDSILGEDAAGRAALQTLLSGTDPYVVVAHRLTEAQSQAIRAAQAGPAAGQIDGITLEPEPVRFYPNPGGAPGTTLASQLLGFVTEDGQGQHGIEQYYNDLLAGTPTKVASLVGPGGTSLESSQQVLQPGRPGSTIQLTIDAGLQLQLEKELYATWVADPSSRVSATIIDPWTGEVLAWASVPGYDENDYSTVASTSPGLFADPIASQIYEPGSVMKMLTAAAALNAGVVTLDQTVQDSTELRFGSDVIRNYDDLSMGRLPFEDAVAYSRNVAVAKVAATLDKTVPTAAARLYGMWQQFGIGQPTGIDLANEAAGIVADPATQPWEPVDLADRAFGQGVAVTQVQLAVAYAAMVNGGMKVTPYLVKQIDDTPHAVAPPTSIISPSLAGQLQSLLQHVTEVVPWYKSGTQIPGYVVGGKTGTAQIWDASANAWEPNTFNFSFDGFVGTDKPRAVITIRIQDGVPDNRGGGNLYLAVASYQLFRRLAIDTMSAMGVPPLTGGQPPIASPSPTPSSRPSGGGGGGANGGSGGSGSGGHGHGPSPSPTPRPTPKPTTSPPARPSPDPSPGPSAGG